MAQPKPRIIIRLGEKYADEYPLVELIGWLDELLRAVPDGYKGSVIAEVGDDGGYYHQKSQLSVYYSRPETQEEADHRESNDRVRREQQIERDIANALAILARHGVSTGE